MADEKVDLKIDGITGERLVRRGDHTELYQATQKQFGRKVAVKVYTADGMRDTALARFERECALMGELTGHPNVVTYFKSGVRRRRPYVVTEWLEEGTYSALLRKGRTLDWADAVNLGIKVCGALESAHRLGLVHRKIKPEDLFVSAFGEPLLGDFQLDPSEGSRAGDPYEIMVHAAPELFRGAAAHPQMDVYALASVIHTLIRGVPPFLEEPDEPLVRIKGRALSVPPPDLRTLGVPAPVHAVLWWALQPGPEHRPVSALVFGRAMQAALSASGRAPAKMLIRPQTDQDRALPEPTLPAAAMALITDTAAAPAPATARVATPTVPPPTAPPPGVRPQSALPPPTSPSPATAPPPSIAQPRAAEPTPAPTPPPAAAPSPPPAPALVPAAAAESAPDRSDASMSPIAVVERVRALLRMARQAYTDPLERDRIDDLERRLDEPLRVAIAGKVKAGKSTLLNGLVGEELAPTDASECTRIVTWYVDGLTYKATMHLHDGRQIVTPFSRQTGAIDVDLQGYPADRVAEIRVEWPSSSLNELSLIDTPGIASISTDLSARTHQFVLAEADHESKADAVVYLMRHLHPTDIRFLESFQDTQAGRTNPINAIGVLSRADELAGAQDTALQSAARVAARYRNSPQVRRLCQTVVPVAGLLAQASATLRQSEYNLLARIAALPTDQLDVLTASADRFVDHDLVANVVSTDREQLLRRLGLFGVRQALIAIRNGTVDDAPSLAQHLFEQSGLAELRRVLTTQFSARRDVLKSQAALQALAQRLRISPPPHDADRLQFEIERLRSTAHVFNEIQLFAAIRSGAVGFAESEMDAVECLLGSNGYDPSTRLGLDPATPPEAIVGELNERIRHWRARAENPLSSRELSDAAQVLVRTCEGMLRAMLVDQAV
jgi:serine/threonine protein kinase